MTLNWFAYVNPMAGSDKTLRHWRTALSSLQDSGYQVEVYEVGHPESFSDWCKTRRATEHLHLIVVGGDGTLHQAINEIVGKLALGPESWRCILFPAGTGNDFARHWNIPMRPKAWLRFFETARLQYTKLGQITFHRTGHQHYFVNAAGAGIDGNIVQHLQTKKASKDTKYLTGLIHVLRSFVPIRTSICGCEGTPLHCSALYTVLVALGSFAGNGLLLAPHAKDLREKFAVTVVPGMPKWRAFTLLPSLVLGRITSVPNVKFFESDCLNIETLQQGMLLVQADGEFLGEAPCTVRIRTRKFPLMTWPSGHVR